MQPPSWTEFLHCCVCVSKFNSHTYAPVSLSCGHTVCLKCLAKLKSQICPYDKNSIGTLAENHPKNYALLQLIEDIPDVRDGRYPDVCQVGVVNEDRESFLSAMEALDKLAQFLLPLADQGVTNNPGSHLTKPMLRKLVSIVTCQSLESEGRGRILRAARSIADRTVTELLVMHQNQQQLSTQLWTAVKNRGCQFLGPVMQEEALKLVLMVLQSGKFMARKTIVLYVVQKLLQDFPQASKTSVGHVVQLLYRASCFNVEKREDDSSLMQLKEECRTYELLRREHDAQVIRIAMEAGLRISPEQLSSLLYGNPKHKSDMQSIIDKLISQGATSSGLDELVIAIRRSQDPYSLSEKILPHLETLQRNDVTNNETCTKLANSWSGFGEYMSALHDTLQGFSTFMQIQSGRFKTGLCPALGRPEGCPRGDKCTYAHSEEEREVYRNLSKGPKPPKARTEPVKPVGPSRVGQGGTRGRHSGDFGPPIPDQTLYTYLPSQTPAAPVFRDYFRQSSGERPFETARQPPSNYPFTDATLSTDPSLRVIPQATPTKPAQYYAPTHYTYHTHPSTHQYLYDDATRGVVQADRSYFTNQDHRGVLRSGGSEVTSRPNSYSEENPDPTGYISNPGPSAHYNDDTSRLDDYNETTPSYEWKNYESEQPQVIPTDSATDIERSLTPYSTNPNVPPGSNPASDEATPTTSSLDGTEIVSSDLDRRMENLKLADTLPDNTASSYPLTTAVITSALSRSHSRLEPVHEHQQNSFQHSTLSYSNSEFKYPLHTTVAPHPYTNPGGSDVRTVSSQNINPIPSVSRGIDLQERKARLQQELQLLEMEEHKQHQQHQQQQQQQQQANRWSGPKPGYPPVAVGPRVGYDGGGSPHHSGLIAGPVPGYGGGYHSNPPGGGHYSPHNTMTQQYLQQQSSIRDYQSHPSPAMGPVPQGGLYYTPQPTPSPHHWSGPHSGPPSSSYPAPMQQPSYVVQPQLPAPATLMVQPARIDSSDDGMIAAYLQSLEQEKAFQQQHSYTSPQGAVGMYPPGTLPPRQQYPATGGHYKYTY